MARRTSCQEPGLVSRFGCNRELANSSQLPNASKNLRLDDRPFHRAPLPYVRTRTGPVSLSRLENPSQVTDWYMMPVGGSLRVKTSPVLFFWMSRSPEKTLLSRNGSEQRLPSLKGRLALHWLFCQARYNLDTRNHNTPIKPRPVDINPQKITIAQLDSITKEGLIQGKTNCYWPYANKNSGHSFTKQLTLKTPFTTFYITFYNICNRKRFCSVSSNWAMVIFCGWSSFVYLGCA
jgi:hypothetical protein